MSAPFPANDYRPHIDGLRAVAILLVMLSHVHLGPFEGGFVGVDVFFVISGFLITRLVVTERRATGHFSFRHFYARRGRRILPALFMTCALSAIPAFLLLSPEDLANFGGSMTSTALSVANVFFAFTSGYFESQGSTRPLLHLWSLGVEEQFYLLWPVFVVILSRRSERATMRGIAAVGLASLAASAYVLQYGMDRVAAAAPHLLGWVQDIHGPAFYLMPFRASEFAAGAFLMWAPASRPRQGWLLEGLFLTGLALILVPSMQYSSSTTFPGLAAMVPCLGAALVIYAGGSARAGWLLRNRVAVGIGLVSYSLYLLHWPVIVFYRHYRFREPETVGKLALMAAAAVGAAAMYRFVEQPWRRGSFARWRPRAVFAAAAVATLLVVAPGVWMRAGNGLVWRIPVNRQQPGPAAWFEKELTYCRHRNPTMPLDLMTCQNDRGKAHSIILWGDSHARHLIAGFSEVYADFNVYVLSRSGCLAANGFLGYEARLDDRLSEAACVDQNRRALTFLRQMATATIVLTGTKRDTPDLVAPPTAWLASKLRQAGHTVIILGDVIRPGRLLASCRTVPSWLIPDPLFPERCQPDAAQVAREWRYSDRLIARLPEVVDIRTVQCPNRSCQFADADGTPFFRDTHHLTTAGSVWIVRRLRGALHIAAAAAASSPTLPAAPASMDNPGVSSLETIEHQIG